MPSPNLKTNIDRATAAALVGALAVGLWGWFAASGLTVQSIESARAHDGGASGDGIKNDNTSTAKSFSTSQSPSNEPTRADAHLWTRKLQSGFRIKSTSPVVQTPPKAEPSPPITNSMPAPATPTLEFGLRLVGTVIEKGGSMAIAIDRAGKLDFCREGAMLQLQPEGIRIESVSNDFVCVSYRGQSSNWPMGQTLQMTQGALPATDSPAIPSIPSNADANAPAKKTKSELLDELEMINGNNPLIPL